MQRYKLFGNRPKDGGYFFGMAQKMHYLFLWLKYHEWVTK